MPALYNTHPPFGVPPNDINFNFLLNTPLQKIQAIIWLCTRSLRRYSGTLLLPDRSSASWGQMKHFYFRVTTLLSLKHHSASCCILSFMVNSDKSLALFSRNIHTQNHVLIYHTHIGHGYRPAIIMEDSDKMSSYPQARQGWSSQYRYQ